MGQIFKNALKNNTAFWICLCVAIFLIIGGALTPPRFIIDGSIFIGVGELWAFAALHAFIKAIDTGAVASVKKGDVELTVGHDIQEGDIEMHIND
mgnify:CR=1 FL=1